MQGLTGGRATASIARVKKELRPFHDHVTCDVCGRTILKGERTEPYLAQGGERHVVCELCFARADQAGWIRESEYGQQPARNPRPQERRALFGRLRRRGTDAPPGEQPPVAAPEPEYAYPPEAEVEPRYDGDAVVYEEAPPVEELPVDAVEEAEAPSPAPRPRPRPRGKLQDPRHVRGVPSTPEAKVERALELFNASEHQRTVAGLSRSLGAPWATAQPDADASSTVNLVVAWELSWYRFRIDLGDASEPVGLIDKGDELEDIDESLKDWNAGLDAGGRLVIGVVHE